MYVQICIIEITLLSLHHTKKYSCFVHHIIYGYKFKGKFVK